MVSALLFFYLAPKGLMVKLIQQQQYLNLPDFMFDICQPKTFSSLESLVLNNNLFSKYGFFLSDHDDLITALFNTQNTALALAYAGHQFGHYSPKLGDGRAHMLGQFQTADKKLIDVQLKGSGRTKYSRQGDGVATLSAILREYIISEALAGLNIPTTRTLAIIGTGENVMRDFKSHQGAIQVRTAETHLRFGSFQYAYAANGKDGVKALADFAINYSFPEFKSQPDKYTQLLQCIALKQAEIIAKWMSVGFVHGVMNTDNMSLLESIDFGPCAFLDEFTPTKAFSAIDSGNRYAWSQQGLIGHWNLQRFAETLLPLLHDDKDKAVNIANEQLNQFIVHFEQALDTAFLMKFGLISSSSTDIFMRDTLVLIEQERVDFTCFFDAITQIGSGNSMIDLPSLFQNKQHGTDWLNQWHAIRNSLPETGEKMQKINPRIIARNHQVEKAIMNVTENNDYTLFNKLCTAVKTPYTLGKNNCDLQMPPKENERVHRTFCGT